MLRRFAPAAVKASADATTDSPSSAMNSASAEPNDCATVRAAPALAVAAALVLARQRARILDARQPVDAPGR